MDKILFLKPIFFERIWGGENLKNFNFNIPQGKIGEAWVIAAHDNGSSTIINGELAGKSLKDAYSENYSLFTTKQYKKFPLLVKILDASDNLSVQVHPDDSYANTYENGELGKTECWHVLGAKDNSSIIYGHTAKNKEQFNRLIDEKKWEKLFINQPVKKDDFFYIPAGTLHAIGSGILIYEVQQNSDTTYRVYDYDRLEANGLPRELHIEKTKDVTTTPFEKFENKHQETIAGDARITTLIEENYFTTFKININGKANLKKNNTGNLFTVLSGSGKITIDNVSYDLNLGDSFILTTSCTNYQLEGNMFLMGSFDN